MLSFSLLTSLSFSQVLEEAEHEDTHAVIRFRYSVQVVGQKGFRAGKPEQIEETSHFVKKDGLWLFNDGMTDRERRQSRVER